MRIHRVEIEGFGPFRDRQIVDLDAYAADGLFLIGGRTGAGKSSILDAVAFAIFGAVPRYEGGEKRLRSDHCATDDPTLVSVEFTSGDTRWRIERSPEYERPKKRGEGMTTSPATARMGEVVGGDVVWRAAKDRDVATLVAEEIGLTKDQFLQVILLAQGRFAEFLLAGNNDRQKLLRTLFGSRRFEDYEKELERRRVDADAAVADGRRALDAVLVHAEALAAQLPARGGADGRGPGEGADDPGADEVLIAQDDDGAGPAGDRPTPGTTSAPAEDQRLAGLAHAESRARHEIETAEASDAEARRRRDAASTAYDRLRADREKQRQRDELRSTLDALEARADEIDVARDRLGAARRAESVRGAIDAATRALAAAASAADAVDAVRREWSAVSDDRDHDPAALDAIAAEAQQHVGEWQPARDVERGMAAKERALADLRAEEQAHAKAIAELATALTAIPAERARLDEAATVAATAAAGAVHAADRVASLSAQLDAAREGVRLAEAYAQASQDADAALRAREAADAHLADLHRRRLGGIAGELAEKLVDDQACVVCGSTAHPSPAPRADDHVTADEIDAAEESKSAASRAELAASDARRDAQRALADAEARAGGRAVGPVEEELMQARAERDAADAASAELSRLEAAKHELVVREQRLDREREEADTARAERAAAIRSLDDELARDRAAVEAARGDAPSIAARIDAARDRAAAATSLAQALRAAARAEEAATDAADALAEAATAAGFLDVESARAAILDAERQQALDAQIAAHDAELRNTKATLVDLELLVLPEEPVDVDAAARALADAAADLDDAVARLAAMRQLATGLADALAHAEDAYAAIADAAREASVVRALADAVAGRNTKKMDLETFVLAAELEGIVEAANRRLADMSAGRYALQHTDALAYRNAASGLGLEVMDRYTGQARPPRSLSGGETFLASLALALGLAEVVTNRAGGITLDTLFIDEGFGSLDAETLEVAMRTLDGLREGGRTVGIISHVEAIKEQIPAQLRVERSPQGWSTVTQ
ncbi:AAA family ATPase [Microbacterium sp. NPDC055683]